MDWIPISLNELNLKISKEVETWPVDLLEIFNSFKNLELRSVKCKRGDKFKTEEIFEILRHGENVIIFDDVEDEFGIAKISFNADATLKDWSLFPDLKSAFQEVLKI